MELLEYWKLRERPFEATWDTRFYFGNPEHDEALDRLRFLVEEESMNLGMLTGEIGCGKTLTRAVFSQRLNPKRFDVVIEDNSSFTFDELLESILQTLDPEWKGTSKLQRWKRLQFIARQIRARRRHLVLIFDEAQEMTQATLNELKLLTNLNGAGQNYLTLILLGQPELRNLVATLPAIDQRISLRFHLRPFNLDESYAYIRHRLMAAGHKNGELFDFGAMARGYDSSKGVPRELNRLAKLALEYAWLRELPIVTHAAMDTVVRDLERNQQLCAA
jgi:general secretion pathway protein A